MAPPAATEAKPPVLGEAETITIDGPSFDLELPLLDHARRIYPKIMIIYKLPSGLDQARFVKTLESAVNRIVQRIPWLACELKVNPSAAGLVKGLASGMMSKSSWVPSAFKQTPEQALKAKQYFIVAPGPALLLVRRNNPEVKYASMTTDDFHEDLFPQLPLKEGKEGTEKWPGMGVQALFTADGYMFLSFAIHHALADGRSAMDIARLLAEEFRNVEAGNTDGKLSPLPGILDRSRVIYMPDGPVTKKMEDAHPALKIWGATEAMSTIVKMQGQNKKQNNLDLRFLLSRKGLSSLIPASNPLQISPHDLACALVWRATMASRLAQGKITQKAVVGFGMSVCLRRHMNHKGQPFFGNAFSVIQVHLPLAELLDSNGLLSGALVIRKGIAACDLEDARKATALYVSASDLRLVQSREIANLGTTFCFLTSWNSFPAWDINWGPSMGTYKGVQMPSGNRPDGLNIILSPDQDGDFNAAVALEDKNFEMLKMDDVWQKYTKPAPLVF